MKLMLENSKNKEYLNLINEKLKKLKLKLIIYFILIFILGLLFLYYVSAFCAVYRYSQKYWFYGFLESFGMDFMVAFVTCLILSLLRFIAIRKKKKFLLVLYNIIGIFLWDNYLDVEKIGRVSSNTILKVLKGELNDRRKI